jgi:hypothetical protein
LRPHDYARREASKRIIAATAEADIGIPDRPQTARRLSEEIDDLFDNRFGRRRRRDPHEQRAPAALRGLGIIEKDAQAFAINPAERGHRPFRRAENERRDGLFGQRFRRDACEFPGVGPATLPAGRSETAAVLGICLGHVSFASEQAIFAGLLHKGHQRPRCPEGFDLHRLYRRRQFKIAEGPRRTGGLAVRHRRGLNSSPSAVLGGAYTSQPRLLAILHQT